MSDIPETNEPKVAMLAIAWSMVKEVHGSHFKDSAHAETVKRVTNEVLRVYSALVSGRPIGGELPQIKLTGNGLSAAVSGAQVGAVNR